LGELLAAINEVGALQRANPSPSDSSPFRRPEVTRAIGRAQVVLLSSHFERYIYQVNEEAVEFLVARAIEVGKMPLQLRLLHARPPAEELVQSKWEQRETALRDFSTSEARLWVDTNTLDDFEHSRLLEWMKAPKSKEVVRYYKYWGIGDMFAAVTRTNSNRRDLWLRIDELVNKRNNIAHGDLSIEATHLDVSKYLGAIRKFTTRSDRRFGRALGRLAGTSPPW
jgi:hypothetical protein